MPSFRKPKAQAERAVQQMLSIGSARHTNRHDGKIHSLGTKRNYIQALTRVTEWIQKNKAGDLRSFNQEKAIRYLEERSESIGQKTLNQERQAIQKYLKITLPAIKSELIQIKKSRSYTQQQIHLIIQAQTARNQLATQIASAAGLRAHELLTLRRKADQTASTHRTWSSDRFIGRNGEIYTVIGKGGLIREVLIPTLLATALESKKLATPKVIKDRDIRYTQYYDINGGKNWSNSFTNASKRALDRSNGAHGLRHSYAQDRMEELQQRGIFYQDALSIVSQEMGHFRSTITEVYLK
jgi:integrase